MTFYKFTDYGRQLTFKTWQSLGGCGIPNNTQAQYSKDVTLGDIGDQCPFTERCLARYAVETLKMDCFAVEA